MTTQNRIKTVLTLAAVAMAILAASANAATMSASVTAPVVDGEDIANYGTTTSSDKWWPDLATSYGNPGKTVGQTFTTGSEDVLLKGLTYQIASTQKAEPTKTYTIRVGTVSGTTFTEIASETATQTFTWNASEYMTWTFDTPVLLSANTVYGVDVGLNSSTSGWTTGIPYVYYMNTDVYPGGTRFRSGTAGNGVGDTSMTQVSGDRVFHVDLSFADPNLPSVDAGVDMVTWSGQAVQLDPNVVNNDTQVPQRPLSYAWSAELPDGVEFSDPAALAPTVTITKATDNPSVVTLTLAVTLEGKDPVTDTMTIDVYDDACLAAIDLGLAVIDPTDLDENCITNFEDIAVMATTWLVDYTLTEPVAK